LRGSASAIEFAMTFLPAFEPTKARSEARYRVVVGAVVPTSASLSTYGSPVPAYLPFSSSRLYEITDGKSLSL